MQPMFARLIALSQSLGLIPVIAVVVGWVLHELSDKIKLNREDKRAAGKVLAELLDLRHSIRGIPVVLAELRKRTNMPPEAEPAVRTFFSSMISQATAGLSERYNAAIDLLAGPLPLLAYQLRSKDRLHPVLDQLRAIMANDPKAPVLFAAIEDKMRSEVLTRMDALVFELAWMHGWRTWLRVRWNSRKPDEAAKEVGEFLDSMLKNLNVPPPEHQ
jgi:hypothetical protein